MLRKEDEPKYLNSPETPLFNKSATLYGLHLAKKPIIDAKTAVVVEGYTDVIACHQAGHANVVATLGTALTGEHVRALARFAERVVVIFDADEAGQKAAERALDLFLTGEVDVAIATLPDGLDPFDLMMQPDGPARWEAAIADAKDALEHQFEQLRTQMEAAGGMTGRQRIAEAYLQRLGRIGLDKLAPVRRGLLLQRLAGLLHLPEREVQRLLDVHRRDEGRKGPRDEGTKGRRDEGTKGRRDEGMDGSDGDPSSLDPFVPSSLPSLPAFDGEHPLAPGDSRSTLKRQQRAERTIIGCLIRENDLFHREMPDGRSLDEALPDGLFTDGRCRALYAWLHDRLAEADDRLTLAQAAASLTEDERTDLTTLLIDAEHETQAAAEDRGVPLATLLDEAVRAVHAHEDRREIDREKAAVLSGGVADEEGDQALRRLAERLANAPSRAQIARGR